MGGVSNRELIRIANELERTIVTRDSGLTTPRLLSLTKYGVIYISYQFSRDELPKLAERIASIAY